MNLIRFVFLALAATLVMTQAAFAETNHSLTEAQLSKYADTLDEMMTPDELMQEMGIPQNPIELFSYSDRLTIIVDKAKEGTSPTAQTMQVYLDGQMIDNFYISTGREKSETTKSGSKTVTTTPPGDFRIQWRDKDHFSKQWQAPMPFAQFFNGGIAIHATVPAHYKELGKRASGGCVRMHLEAAETMWNLVDEVGSNNVLIRIVDNSKN